MCNWEHHQSVFGIGGVYHHPVGSLAGCMVRKDQEQGLERWWWAGSGVMTSPDILQHVWEHTNWAVGNQVRSFVKLTLHLTRVPALVSGPSSPSSQLKILQSGDRPSAARVSDSPYTKHGLLMCFIKSEKHLFYVINQLTVYTQRRLFIFYFTCSLETASTLLYSTVDFFPWSFDFIAWRTSFLLLGIKPMDFHKDI